MLKKYPTIKFISTRAGWYFITLLVAVTLNFTLPRLGPNNPVDIIMGQFGSGLSAHEAQQREERYLMEFGLIRMKGGEIVRDGEGRPIRTSLIEQYGSYVGMLAKGDLGTSFRSSEKVWDIILRALPWTLALQIPTIILGWFIGNLFGAYAAYRRGIFDKALFPMALFLNSFPFFVFGMLLVYAFAILFRWFPPMGGYDLALMPGFSFAFILSAAHHYVLPFLSIFLIGVGGGAIGMRTMGIYELGTDYIKYAKWLGLKESKVLFYVFRNAMLPQITGLALSLGTMVGGALITEMIFSYPGLGMAMLSAIQNQDYAIIQGVTLIITVSVLIANFSVDMFIAFFDPRVKAGIQMGKGG
ncbi:MAG: ABC transporter permease [Chitinispirillales bacterium]|jgi:peptide/nickel transport system permease protein|nr:ABC transporter permease [Chitinispirillales bacterium]